MTSEAVLRLADRGRRRRWSGQVVFLSLSILAVLAAFAYRLGAEANEIDADIALAAAPGAAAEPALQDQDLMVGASSGAGITTRQSDEMATTPLQATASAGGEDGGEGSAIRSRQLIEGRSSGSLSGLASPDEPDTNPGRSSDSALVVNAGDPTPSTVAVATSQPPSTTTTTAPSSTTTSRPTTTVPPSTTTSRPSTTNTTRTPTTKPPSTEPPTSEVNGPVARNDEASGDAGKNLKIRVLENDSEGGESIDKDTLTIIGGPSHAKDFRVHGDHIHYESVDDFSGVDRLSYQVCDKAGACDQATVVIAIED
jgi:hypothetical protein